MLPNKYKEYLMYNAIITPNGNIVSYAVYQSYCRQSKCNISLDMFIELQQANNDSHVAIYEEELAISNYLENFEL